MEAYPTNYEIIDEKKTIMARIELVDAESVVIKINDEYHTVESWQEFSKQVEKTIKHMLKGEVE